MVIALAAMAALLAATPANPGISVPDILELTDISGLSVSPDGRQIAFRTEQPSISGNDYRLDWWVLPLDQNRPAQRIAGGGDALFDGAGMVAPEAAVWRPDSKAILFRALVDRQVQIWQAPIDGSGGTAITQDAANIRAFSLAADGKSLTYRVAATRAEIEDTERAAHDDGVLVDASVDLAQPISDGAWLDGKPASERFTGHWFTRGNILWDTPSRSIQIELPPGDGSDSDTPRGPTIAAATFDIRRVDGEARLIATRADGTSIMCAARQCEDGRPVSARLLPGSDMLVVTTANILQDQTISLWRPGSPTARTLVSGVGLMSGDREIDTPCAASQAILVCVAASAISPPALVTIDVATGQVVTRFDPNDALRERIDATTRPIEWHDASGNQFSGQLLLPKAMRPSTGYPLVLNYYDCPGFLRGGLGDELPMLPLVDRGIAVLCINQPHTTSPQRDAQSDYRRALSGVSTIIAQLSREKLIDRSRVGMWGLSFGSEITMLLAQQPRFLAAASIATGQIEPSFYWYNGVAGRDTPEELHKTWGLGDPSRDLTSWKRVSPALNAERIQTPLLMQLPEQEARWSMQLYSTLSRSPTPVELYAFADEPHIKQQPRHKAAAYERNLDWFLYWLRGYRDPAPAKSAQYSRWDNLSERRSEAGVVADHSRP